MRQAITKIEILIGAVVLVAAGIVMVPGLASRGIAEDRERCLANLGFVGEAMAAYFEDSGDTWPAISKLRSVQIHTPAWPTLTDVLGKYTSGGVEKFHCPADRRALSKDHALYKEFGGETTWFETEGTSYEWLMGDAYAGKKIGQESLASAKGFGMGRADMPLISEFEPFHEGDGKGSFNTLNADLKPRTARDEVAR